MPKILFPPRKMAMMKICASFPPWDGRPNYDEFPGTPNFRWPFFSHLPHTKEIILSNNAWPFYFFSWEKVPVRRD